MLKFGRSHKRSVQKREYLKKISRSLQYKFYVESKEFGVQSFGIQSTNTVMSSKILEKSKARAIYWFLD